MMSSEEDTECFGLYDKLLVNVGRSKKKTSADKTSLSNSNSNSSTSSNPSYTCSSNIKHNRFRVDAGEPRNTYNSIPNFSSRSSSFMSSASTGIGGLYGALLNSTQTAHFVGGLFGPNGFGSTKMLNEIFSRQMKKAQDATSGLPTSLTDNSILTAAMETATSGDLLGANISSNLGSSKLLNSSCVSNTGTQVTQNVTNSNSDSENISSNSSPTLTTEDQRVNSSEALDIDSANSLHQRALYSGQQQHQDLAHHMLRNILQGKKDLIVLDQELRSVINQHNNNLNLNSNSDVHIKGVNCEHIPITKELEINKAKHSNKSISNSNNNDNSESHIKNVGSIVKMQSSHVIDCNCESGTPNDMCKNGGDKESDVENSACLLTNIVEESGRMEVKSEVDVTATINITNIPSNLCMEGTLKGNNNESNANYNSNNTKQNNKVDVSNRNIRNFVSDNKGPASNECVRNEENQIPNNTYQMQRRQSDCQEMEDFDAKKESDDLLDDETNSRSDLEFLGSPDDLDVSDIAKDQQTGELDKNVSEVGNQTIKSRQPFVLDVKKARVEHIVSSMRSSPSLHQQSHVQVNGCKKRKLYQPQQHAMEEYAAAAASLNFGFNFQSLMLEEDDEDDMESPQIQQKRVEKNALKSQLRSMQEQLAEMQQKYVQLCTRMEQESENQDIEETASDSAGQEYNQASTSPTPSLTDSAHLKTRHRTTSSSPSLYTTKLNKKLGVNVEINKSPQFLTQIMSKMMTPKSHNHSTINPSHQMLQQLPHVSKTPNNMPSITNAAAMYLSQKFLHEQEARVAKEAADLQHQQESQRREHHEPQQKHKGHQQNQQRQHLLNQQQNQRQEHLQYEQNHQQLEMRQISVQSNSLTGSHASVLQSQRSQQQQQQSHISTSIHSSIKSEISEKFNMLRSHSSSIVRMSGSDLEGLADVLKSEITTSLSTLVDTIVTRFVNQRKQFNRQSQSVAAAAEQLNKDLLMASQILERKSPRSKAMEDLSSNLINTTLKGTTKPIQHPTSIQPGNGVIYNSTNNQIVSSNCNINNESSSNHNNPSSLLLPSRLSNTSCNTTISGSRINGSNVTYVSPSNIGMQLPHTALLSGSQNQQDNITNSTSLNVPSPHIRHSSSTAVFQAPKTPQNINPVAAAALYNSINAIGNASNPSQANQINHFCVSEAKDQNIEQNEALSLVVTPKKKRHKVTDTRITPRTVSRILAQDTVVGSPTNTSSSALETSSCQNSIIQNNKYTPQISNNNVNISMANTITTPSQSPSPRSNQFHQPPPPPQMMPVSLPTSVAIPNPSLHESQVFSPYSPFFNPHHGPHGPHGGSHAPPIAGQMHHIKMSSSPPGLSSVIDSSDSPPLPQPPNMLHPALLAAAHGSSPDYGAHLRAAMDAQDRSSECNSAELQFDGIQPTISFLKHQIIKSDSLTPLHSSTLTPMHLRKAKLMFFWVRYPSSAVLKMYFPDIKFNKNNTAQLVKWFSNFREFYYIQMEKYARQAVTEGIKSGDDIHVGGDSELYRVLNLHYNRNNHIEVPSNFRYVVEQTLREFFRAIQSGKDTEQSWKKSIYKIISRLDDPVPEYFKSPNFLEQLE